MNKHILKKIIAFIIVASLFVQILPGCTDIAMTTPDGTAGWVTDDPDVTDNQGETIDDVVLPIKGMYFSDNWEDYVGDIETFVYGLLITQLENYYDIFPGVVELNDGNYVYGIAYTDYSECYTNDDESIICFSSGFLPFYGELEIPESDFDNGLVIKDLDYTDEHTYFSLTYMCEPFLEHCVVYGQYLKYGIDDKGRITYEYSKYESRICDESLGSLYSYDEQKYLFVNDVGNYNAISGESLSSQIDYVALEKEINAVIEAQDINFSSVDITSCAYIAQDAIVSYLLSLQEETFLGYNVDVLIEAASQLDPMECIRINNDGVSIVNIERFPEGGATALTKWLVGTGCVIVVAVGLVSAYIYHECPAISSLIGAATGTAIEMFMQVVINGTSLADVDWMKVAIATASGAISGLLDPYMHVIFEEKAYFLLDSALDGLITGIEQSVTAWINGEDGIAIIESFGAGFAIGFAISAAFKGTAKLLIGLVGKMPEGTGKVLSRITKKISKFTDPIDKKLKSLKGKADSSFFHSKYISDKLTDKQIARVISKGDKNLYKKSLNTLNKSGIHDNNGNIISKDSLTEVYNKAHNGSNIGYFEVDGEKIIIRKENGIIGVYFDSTKYQTVKTEIYNDRSDNFKRAAEQLKKSWIKNPDKIPESIADGIKNSGISLEDMSPEKLVKIIQKSDMVLHENADLKSVTLVSRKVHDKAEENGIAHMGGYALINYFRTHMGKEYFERIAQSASSWAIEAIT